MSHDSLSKRLIFVISDSTGETASRAAKVALEQFFGVEAKEKRFPNVRSQKEVVSLLHSAAQNSAFVVYTLVDHTLCAAARAAAEEYHVPAVDILKDLLPSMSTWLEMEPNEEAGHRLDEAYFASIAAIDFAQQHDDGQHLNDLHKADIVIVGLSRTSKTPVSHDLARKGIRAANIPLVLEVPPPEELKSVDPKRVFVLMMQAERLRTIRVSRLSSLGTDVRMSYANPGHIDQELQLVRHLVRRNPRWTTIDVTNRAIEEIAAQILRRYQEHFNNV